MYNVTTPMHAYVNSRVYSGSSENEKPPDSIESKFQCQTLDLAQIYHTYVYYIIGIFVYLCISIHTWLIHLQYYYCKIFHELLFVYIYLPFARIVVQKTLFISFRYVLVKKILFIVSHCGVLHLCLYYLWSNYERFKLVQGFHVIYIEIFQLILL